MTERRVTIRLDKENMKFSAGHFTIFSATERERLHGHNFKVAAALVASVADNGLCFDYGIFKQRLVALCRELNEYFILPTQSPYLKIERQGDQLSAVFGAERIPFLARDVLLLPIANATLEEFSAYLLGRLIADADEVAAFGIREVEVQVSSGPGQSASSRWVA